MDFDTQGIFKLKQRKYDFRPTNRIPAIFYENT